MQLAILIFIIVLGLTIPLFWIIGTVTSITYFCLHRAGAAQKDGAVALNPQLGLTMADGGDPIDEEDEEQPKK